jgi:2-methylisocitrate lyase-like PEP mutase family enzyme
MGKLIDKLKQVGQGNGGSFGFFGRGQAPSSPARPAAVLVTLTVTDTAAAEAAAKAGADGIIIAGWKPSADVKAIKSTLESANVLWGVEYSGGAEEEVATAAQQAGAGFLLLGPEAQAAPLYDQPEQFDRVVTLSAPNSEMDLLLYRMANALPAQAALITLPVGMRDLPKQSVSDFARLALLSSSVRFPLLAVVDETPNLRAARTLVRLGFDGIVLTGVGASADQIAQQIQSLRADLEKIPLSEGQEREGVSLGGMISNLGAGVQPERREPEKDPDHE